MAVNGVDWKDRITVALIAIVIVLIIGQSVWGVIDFIYPQRWWM